MKIENNKITPILSDSENWEGQFQQKEIHICKTERSSKNLKSEYKLTLYTCFDFKNKKHPVHTSPSHSHWKGLESQQRCGSSILSTDAAPARESQGSLGWQLIQVWGRKRARQALKTCLHYTAKKLSQPIRLRSKFLGNQPEDVHFR